jgi:hypothetical protein
LKVEWKSAEAAVETITAVEMGNGSCSVNFSMRRAECWLNEKIKVIDKPCNTNASRFDIAIANS